MNEVWKDIKDWEGRYQVSNLGRVRSVTKSIIMKPTYHKSKRYPYVCLEHFPVRRKYQNIHRLVAEAFIPNPDNLPVVMHLDDNPHHNTVSNLKWGTQSENVLDGLSRKLKK